MASIGSCEYCVSRSCLGDMPIVSGNDKNDIVSMLATTYAYHGNKTVWEKYYTMLIPLYQKAMTEKYQPFKPGTDAGYALIRLLIDKSKLAGGAVVAFVTTLHDLARDGVIEVVIWNPLGAAGTEDFIPRTGTEKFIADTLDSAGNLTNAVADKLGISGIVTKALVAGAIVAVIYLLGKDVIRKKL